MNARSTLFCAVFLSLTIGTASQAICEQVLLEDYENGGVFEPADWANSFKDSLGNPNAVEVVERRAVVDWATKWSGLPSTGPVQDFSRFRTFQADVMVEKGQPIEEGSNFYFQLNNQSETGYSYWEAFVPQTKIPADGQWYRLSFPMKVMDKGNGDGGEPPSDFSTVNGTVCGMTYDETPDKFKMKQAHFDNLTLTDEEISETKVKPRK